MIPIDVPYPHVGSRAFERETGRELTIIRRNPEGTLFCRRDDRPRGGFTRSGPATGNVTLDAADVVGSIDETALAIPRKPRRKAKAQDKAQGKARSRAKGRGARR